MKLDRLKELAAGLRPLTRDDQSLYYPDGDEACRCRTDLGSDLDPSTDLAEYIEEVQKALPGLLRVCDAFIEAETFRLNESGVWYPDEQYDVWRSGNREKAEKKLEELLG